MSPEPQELEPQVTALATRALDIIVRDQPTYEGAAEFLKMVKTMRQRVAETFDPIISKAYAAHREACAQKRKHDEPLELAEKTVKASLARFEQQQETLRLEAQATLAEEQRKRLQDDALLKAVVAEANGAPEAEVQAIMHEPDVAPTPIAPPTFNRVQGISIRADWSCEVHNKKLLDRAIADSAVSNNLTIANMPVLDALARHLKEGFNVPGCRAVKDTIVAARGRE
ncbi:MAG: hypothetical protein ACREUQ_03325 [Burkholderiales bacterium]